MTIKQYIDKYIKNSFKIVTTLNKVPTVAGWQHLIEEGNNEQYLGYIINTKEAGFVVPKDVCVIDVDPRNFPKGKDSLQKLSDDIGYDLKYYASYITHTASGGIHLYYNKRPEVKLPNSLPEYLGVEFKSEGRQVVIAGSVLPDGREYVEDEDQKSLENIIHLPDSFYAVVKATQPNKIKTIGVGYKDTEEDIAIAKKRLKDAKPAVEGQNGDEHTYKICCIGKELGISKDVFFELLQDWNNRCEPAWNLDDLQTKVTNAYKYGLNPPGSSSVKAIFSYAEQEANDGWKDGLDVSKNGGFCKTLKNTATFVKNEPSTKGKLAYNRFSNDKVWIKPAPWHKDANKQGHDYYPDGKIFTDHDAIEIKYMLNCSGFDAPTQLIYESVVKVSHENNYHPVKEWLDRNPKWDGKPRVESFFSKYCGSEDNKYTKEVARKLFCGIVARITNPGCKFDYLPILVGDQGVRKSTLLKTLSIQSSWFCDNIGDITNLKELIPQTKGKLIVEWQELTLFNKIDINHSKSFLSTCTDRVREAYHREAKDYPRQFVVVATTNQDKFLLDETGNRRMLPIQVHQIDIQSVARDVPQLYAEALHLYKKGEKLYIDDEEALSLAEEEREHRFRDEGHEELIKEWLDNMPKGLPADVTKERLQARDVVIHCLKEDPIKNRRLSLEVGRVLKRLGYVYKSIRNGEVVKKYYVKSAS